jgi:hypothetical protein
LLWRTWFYTRFPDHRRTKTGAPRRAGAVAEGKELHAMQEQKRQDAVQEKTPELIPEPQK